MRYTLIGGLALFLFCSLVLCLDEDCPVVIKLIGYVFWAIIIIAMLLTISTLIGYALEDLL